MERKTLAVLLTLTMAVGLGLSACSKPAPETEATPTPAPSEAVSAAPAATETPAATEAPGDADPLTGLPMDPEKVNDRPVAVMLNNIKNALPMQGQSEADILYEVPVEGGITRLLGLYQDPSQVPAIGSIRSARTYYLELALGHDAIYLHAGGSPDAYDKIPKWHVSALDGISGTYGGQEGRTLMWRDEWRRKNVGIVHSVITTGDAIARLFPTYNIPLEHPEGYTYEMAFTTDDGAVSAASGQAAVDLTVPFSSGKKTLFQYDGDRGEYLVSEFGEPFVDMNNDQQVSVTNVIVIKTACKMIAGDDKGRITVDLTSGGEGWYACGGKYVPISWTKEFPDGQLRYFDDSGAPLTLKAGKSYVCIIPLSLEPAFE